MMKRVAASVGILVLAGSGGLAHAAGAAARPFPAPGVPKEIASKRVIGGRPLVLGDLKPASDFDADALLGHASNDSKTLARCVEIAQGGIKDLLKAQKKVIAGLA